MALNGALAGLVAITAEPLTPTPLQATLIGGRRRRAGGVLHHHPRQAAIDDPVGAISVHGVVGMWGLMAVPITNGERQLRRPGSSVLGTILGWVFVTSLHRLAAAQADHGHPRQRRRGIRGRRPRRVRPGGLPGVRQRQVTDLAGALRNALSWGPSGPLFYVFRFATAGALAAGVTTSYHRAHLQRSDQAA
jgi:hypothetical protein